MTADYYGNKLEKIFTLYGNSPLVEVQFAVTFKDPDANVIGPQPAMDSYLPEEHDVLYLLPLGSRWPTAEWFKRIKRKKPGD